MQGDVELNPQRNDDQFDMDATEEQLAELRRLGVQAADLQGLSSADAEEWIDELREQRLDAGKFGPTAGGRPARKPTARKPDQSPNG
jgi:hypothetical protein